MTEHVAMHGRLSHVSLSLYHHVCALVSASPIVLRLSCRVLVNPTAPLSVRQLAHLEHLVCWRINRLRDFDPPRKTHLRGLCRTRILASPLGWQKRRRRTACSAG